MLLEFPKRWRVVVLTFVMWFVDGERRESVGGAGDFVSKQPLPKGPGFNKLKPRTGHIIGLSLIASSPFYNCLTRRDRAE